MGVRHRDRGSVIAAALSCLLVVAVPSAAQQVPEPGRTSCFEDGEDDVRRFERPRPREVVDDPRGDILQHCINSVPTRSLTLSVAQPIDPEPTTAWGGATFVAWYLDVDGDEAGDFFVDYSLDRDGRLEARVDDIRGAEAVEVCRPNPSFTGVYSVNGIDLDCLDGATTITSSAVIFFDRVPEGGTDVLFDGAPIRGSFDGPASRLGARAEGRLAGDDRIGTAIAISRAQFATGSAARVYLARRDVLADAVAGGSLRDGPILLVPSCAPVPGEVLAEIERVGADEVVALGGPAAICDATLADAARSRDSSRLAGDTRIETAVAIARSSFPTSGSARDVYLARADVFADAVAGGALTAGPVLLVPSCGALPTAVRTEIDRLAPLRVVALGGSSAVCPELFDEAASGRAAVRRAGPSRIFTAIEISKEQFRRTADTVFLARSDVFADAVAGGVLTAGPILLVPSCDTLPTAVLNEISRVAPERVIALGGPAAICDQVLAQAARA